MLKHSSCSAVLCFAGWRSSATQPEAQKTEKTAESPTLGEKGMSVGCPKSPTGQVETVTFQMD